MLNPAGWNPTDYATHAAFVPALGRAALDLLDPQRGEQILDLGCGDGALTVELVAADSDVLGVDSDAAMLDSARARGLRVEHADGQSLGFAARFDAVFSNAAIHWMPDHAAVAREVFAALRAGGRFVGEMGGHGNIAAIRTAIRAVMMRHGLAADEAQHYPSVAAWTATLGDAGFIRIEAKLIARPTPLPSGLAAWLRTFRAGAFERGSPLAAEVEALLAPSLRDEAGAWTADYVRLRWRAWKP